jgi:hypothetical protein
VAVFVDDATEAVDPFDLSHGAGSGRRPGCREWGLQVEASVWSGGVVVLDVDGQDAFEGLCESDVPHLMRITGGGRG